MNLDMQTNKIKKKHDMNWGIIMTLFKMIMGPLYLSPFFHAKNKIFVAFLFFLKKKVTKLQIRSHLFAT